MCIRVLFVALSLVLTSYVQAAHHEEKVMKSSFSDYESFVSAMQGRWLAKIIWINGQTETRTHTKSFNYRKIAHLYLLER